MHAAQRSLAINIAATVGSVLLLNGIIFGFGWNMTTGGNRSGLLNPPGALVGLVWVGLFTGLGYGRWWLNRHAEIELRWLFDGLIILCLTYPLYVLAPGLAVAGLVANAVILVYGLYLAYRLWHLQPAARVVLAVCVWLAYANAVTAATVFAN